MAHIWAIWTPFRPAEMPAGYAGDRATDALIIARDLVRSAMSTRVTALTTRNHDRF